MTTQDSDGNTNNKTNDASNIDKEASSIAKSLVGSQQSTVGEPKALDNNTINNANTDIIKANEVPKPAKQSIIAPAKPHLSIVNGETKADTKSKDSVNKKKRFSIPFLNKKDSGKVKLSSGTKINKKFTLIPVALIAIFGSYLIISSFAYMSPFQGNDGLFTPLNPARILDTRTKTDITKGTPVGAGQTIDVQVAGKGGVPIDNVRAVVLNVTAVGPTAAGHARIWPSDSGMPNASSINFSANTNIANGVTVKLGTDGKVKIYNSSGNTNYVFDVAGYYSAPNGTAGSRFTSLNPARILDTRTKTDITKGVPVGPNQTIDVQVAGKGGVPVDNVRAVVLNVTAVGPTAAGHARIWPSDSGMPNASSINFSANTNIANGVTVKLGADGKVKIYNSSGNTNYVFDVAGYYSDDHININAQYGRFTPMAPKRILDTRDGNGGYRAPVGPSQSIDVQVASYLGVSAIDISAVVLNVTAVGPTAAGHARIWPSDSGMPNASSINFSANTNIANGVTVKLGADGKVKIYNSSGNTNYVFDVAGYYSKNEITANMSMNGSSFAQDADLYNLPSFDFSFQKIPQKESWNIDFNQWLSFNDSLLIGDWPSFNYRSDSKKISTDFSKDDKVLALSPNTILKPSTTSYGQGSIEYSYEFLENNSYSLIAQYTTDINGQKGAWVIRSIINTTNNSKEDIYALKVSEQTSDVKAVSGNSYIALRRNNYSCQNVDSLIIIADMQNSSSNLPWFSQGLDGNVNGSDRCNGYTQMTPSFSTDNIKQIKLISGTNTKERDTSKPNIKITNNQNAIKLESSDNIMIGKFNFTITYNTTDSNGSLANNTTESVFDKNLAKDFSTVSLPSGKYIAKAEVTDTSGNVSTQTLDFWK